MGETGPVPLAAWCRHLSAIEAYQMGGARDLHLHTLVHGQVLSHRTARDSFAVSVHQGSHGELTMLPIATRDARFEQVAARLFSFVFSSDSFGKLESGCVVACRVGKRTELPSRL